MPGTARAASSAAAARTVSASTEGSAKSASSNGAASTACASSARPPYGIFRNHFGHCHRSFRQRRESWTAAISVDETLALRLSDEDGQLQGPRRSDRSKCSVWPSRRGHRHAKWSRRRPLRPCIRAGRLGPIEQGGEQVELGHALA